MTTLDDEFDAICANNIAQLYQNECLSSHEINLIILKAYSAFR